MDPNIEKHAVSTLFHFVRVTEVYQPHVMYIVHIHFIELLVYENSMYIHRQENMNA